MLIANIGGSGFGVEIPALRIVPSPPIVTINRDGQCPRRTNLWVFFIFSERLSSMILFNQSSDWFFAFISARIIACFLSYLAIIPAVLNTFFTAQLIGIFNL